MSAVPNTLHTALRVWGKELLDLLRDRKTLVAVLLSSVISVPLMLFIVSNIVEGFEGRAERREVYVLGAQHAPGLVNFLQRQSHAVKTPPEDYEAQLRDSKFGHAVVVVPRDHKQRLARGELSTLSVVYDSSNRNAQGSAGTVRRLVQGYARELSTLNLALRGASTASAQSVEVQDLDLASSASRGMQLMSMLPFFVMMAVLYGALNAALDTTAGERERGSLEPLLSTPAPRWGLVLGKWAAVATVAMGIACVNVASFFPSQLLLKSEGLAAMFQFGGREAVAFLAALVPFAAALSAALMAVAMRSGTYKEAQASSTFVILAVNLTPLVGIVNPSGEQPWHLWLPGLAQQTVMARVLKGEALGLGHLLIPTFSCLAVTVLCLWAVTRTVQKVVVKGA
jgi:sodium transport system permease protein